MTKSELKNEKWLPIANVENYEISDLGRVKNIKRDNRLLSPATNGQKENDYQFVLLNGKKYYVHHMVLQAFTGEKPSGYECDHKNRNRQDNRLSNLQYITIAENRSHKGEAHGNAKLTDKLVKLIRKMVEEGTTQQQIADIIDVSRTTISCVITGRTWSHVL